MTSRRTYYLPGGRAHWPHEDSFGVVHDNKIGLYAKTKEGLQYVGTIQLHTKATEGLVEQAVKDMPTGARKALLDLSEGVRGVSCGPWWYVPRKEGAL